MKAMDGCNSHAQAEDSESDTGEPHAVIRSVADKKTTWVIDVKQFAFSLSCALGLRTSNHFHY